MNTEGELQGFKFVCRREDLAHVLPMSKKTCNMTSVYECLDEAAADGQPLNAHVMRIVQDMPAYRVRVSVYARSRCTRALCRAAREPCRSALCRAAREPCRRHSAL